MTSTVLEKTKSGELPEIKTHEHPFRYSFTTCFKERAIVELIEKAPQGQVLEMGCGSAYFATVLRREFPESNFRYVGLDMSDDALRSAKSFLKKDDVLLKGAVESMPLENSSIDTILYLDVIEHVNSDVDSLKEAFRVLKPGGRMIISTPNSGAPLTDTFFCEYMHDHDHMANQRPGYTSKELLELLKKAGFEVGKPRYTNVFLSELLITVTKLGYRFLKPKYSSQADVVEVSDSVLFKLHKNIFFPLGYLLGRAEEIALSWMMDGHCLIVLARKPL